MNAKALRLGVSFKVPNDTAPFDATAEWVKRHGYSGAMIGLDPDLSDQETERVGRTFADYGLDIYEIGAYTSLIHQDEATRLQNIKRVKRGLEQAAIVGCPCVGTIGGSSAGWLPHPNTLSEASWNLFLEVVSDLLDVTPAGVTFCLESWPPTILPDLKAIIRVMDAFDDPRLGLVFDPANLITTENYFSSGELIDDAFDQLGDRFISIHCKDILWLPDFSQTGLAEVVPGGGTLDYDRLLTRSAYQSHKPPLIIEHLKGEEEIAMASNFIRDRAEANHLTVE